MTPIIKSVFLFLLACMSAACGNTSNKGTENDKANNATPAHEQELTARVPVSATFTFSGKISEDMLSVADISLIITMADEATKKVKLETPDWQVTHTTEIFPDSLTARLEYSYIGGSESAKEKYTMSESHSTGVQVTFSDGTVASLDKIASCTSSSQTMTIKPAKVEKYIEQANTKSKPMMLSIDKTGNIN